MFAITFCNMLSNYFYNIFWIYLVNLLIFPNFQKWKFPGMEILWKHCRDTMEIGRTLEIFLKLNWTHVRNLSKKEIYFRITSVHFYRIMLKFLWYLLKIHEKYLCNITNWNCRIFLVYNILPYYFQDWTF